MTVRFRRALAITLAVLTVDLACPPAVAAPRPPRAPAPAPPLSPAAALKKDADHAMDDLRYGDALDAYARAYAISKDPVLLYNQARASQALGDPIAALAFIERFEADASPALKARVPDLEGLTADLRKRTSSLTITCNVPGAELVLRDVVIGKTPFAAPIRTVAGPATLIVRLEGYDTYTHEIDLPGGGTVAVDAQLRAKDRRGFLLVRAVPGARVSLDGAPRGDAPVEVAVLEGSHELRIEADGYSPTVSSVVTVAGERKELRIDLVKEPSIFSKWWFWTAIGVVVVGGVATYFIVTSEKSAEEGTITPGVIKGPLKVGAFTF